MTSVQSVTCCCLLWLMLSVQLVTPGSPGTAQLSGHRAARVPPPEIMVVLCPGICRNDPTSPLCDCSNILGVVTVTR
uniref:Conotoxin n=1 Tax=Conus praecellens TaxID=128530 RepID=A0A291C2D8_CONPC|nr:conotoxin [Conus praecellens]